MALTSTERTRLYRERRKQGIPSKGKCLTSTQYWYISTFGRDVSDEYEKMYHNQSGKCKICGKFHDRLHIDHNHETGQLRALLCSKCNRGIGFLGDNPENLQKAIEYLHEFNK